MALTKEVVIDKVEVLENGVIQLREVTRIIEDGVQLSSSYHRSVLNPGDDVTSQPTTVQAVANAVWTTEIVEAYKAKLALATSAE